MSITPVHWSAAADSDLDPYDGPGDTTPTSTDYRRINELVSGSIAAAYRPASCTFTIWVRDEPASLTAVLPLLHSLGFTVLDERARTLRTADDHPAWAYDFGVRHPDPIDEDTAARLVDALQALWARRADVDAFNGLITAAGLTWRQANLMRAFARYLRQAGMPYGHTRVARVLQQHTTIARQLINLFDARLNPAVDDPQAAERAETAVTAAITAVTGLDDDRILRAIQSLVLAAVRTNYWRCADPQRPDAALALKFAATEIPELPLPRPHVETFVYATHVEGTHLRYGPVARGGLRWSDRSEDYRTEVLGLARAQTVKNAIIVPAGAKGVFISKNSDVRTCYRSFVAALLDVTDNIDPATANVTPPPGVRRRDGDDAYLVVAADRGTAALSDTANSIALSYGHWLGDAFASGGSSGYDHKALGITAKGAFESVKRHFRERGIDVTSDPYTVVGIGDMSGDVFGNGLLQSSAARLIAAFDHRHIFIDPDPDPARSFTERQRLFDLPRSSWADYDPDLISAGGGVWSRTTKSIPVSAQARAALGLPEHARTLTPDELVTAVLMAPVDLLWNGGVGTYIKAGDESHHDVGDKSNDGVRVDADQLRVKVIAEGGNLGVTPRGRVEFAARGGAINSDAIDNSGGVDCSDHEVNIKILLAGLLSAGRITDAERNDLLTEMTAEVEALVLADNYAQNELLGTARSRAAALIGDHGRLIGKLVDNHGLNRELETLPSDREIARRADLGRGLTSPELATLSAHVKLDIKTQLASSDVLDTGVYADRLLAYFPRQLRGRFADAIAEHPLRKEILATVVSNEIVDVGGISYVFRLTEVTGACLLDAVRAYTAAEAIFDVRGKIAQIRASATSTAAADLLTAEVRRLLDRTSRWLLMNQPQPLDVAAVIGRYRPVVQQLGPRVQSWLRGPDAAVVRRRTAQLTHLSNGDAGAHELMLLLHHFCLLDIQDIADVLDRDVATVAVTYFTLNAHLQVDHLLTAVSDLPTTGRWDAQARLSLRSDIYAAMRTLCADVLRCGAPADAPASEAIALWEDINRDRLARARALLDQLTGTTASLVPLSVAVRQLGSMAARVDPSRFSRI